MRSLISICSLVGSQLRGRASARRSPAPIADAAQNGDRESVRALLKKGLDVNEAQGDGTTALHWAAIKGDAEMAQMLIYAGANVRATTRIGAYTPLYLAAKGGYSDVVAALLAAGADAKAVTSNGTTPLMIAAAAGDTRSITSLIENGADINAKDGAKGETPLIFAAGFNRTDAVKLLLARGADHKVTTKVVDLFALTAPEEEAMLRGAGGNSTAAARRNRPADIAGATRAYRYNELISSQGGLTRAAVRRPPGLHRHREGAPRRRRRHQPGERRRQDQPAADVDHQRPLRSGDDAARARRERERGGVQRRGAALCRAEHPVGAEVALSEPEGVSAAEDDVSRADAGAARQGRRSERARRRARSGIRPTTPITPASTRPARRRSSAPPTPATSRR